MHACFANRQSHLGDFLDVSDRPEPQLDFSQSRRVSGFFFKATFLAVC